MYLFGCSLMKVAFCQHQPTACRALLPSSPFPSPPLLLRSVLGPVVPADASPRRLSLSRTAPLFCGAALSACACLGCWPHRGHRALGQRGALSAAHLCCQVQRASLVLCFLKIACPADNLQPLNLDDKPSRRLCNIRSTGSPPGAKRNAWKKQPQSRTEKQYSLHTPIGCRRN